MSILPEPAWFRNLSASFDDSPPTPDTCPELAEARKVIEEIRAIGVVVLPIPGRDAWTLAGEVTAMSQASPLISELHRLHPYVMAVLRRDPQPEPEPEPEPERFDAIAQIRESCLSPEKRLSYDLKIAENFQRLWTDEVKRLKDLLRENQVAPISSPRKSLLDRLFGAGKPEEGENV